MQLEALGEGATQRATAFSREAQRLYPAGTRKSV